MTTNDNNDISSKMSQRLITIAELLRDEDTSGELCRCTADVGCDHGYVSIYLLQHGISQGAIAMDVRKGPLMGAKDNISQYGLSDRIATRLSDGLKELAAGEADSLVIAGMGGKLMQRILEDGNVSALGIQKGVLQPQSEIQEFRQYLRDRGYLIEDERVVLEDGKYYFPMKVVFKSDLTTRVNNNMTGLSGMTTEESYRICNRFGEHNIIRRDPLLKEFLLHGKSVCESILGSLDRDLHTQRYEEVSTELSEIEAVLKYFEKE